MRGINQVYQGFALMLECKIEDKGNSGVFIHDVEDVINK